VIQSIRSRVAVLALSVLLLVGTGLSLSPSADAHSYVVGASCLNRQIFYVQHIDVNWGWDRHETRVRYMSYNEYLYYCGGL
jgi:hypothetical protein